METKGWLAIYEISGIQKYIFASNRLQENAGASRIVSRALSDWINEAMDKALGTASRGAPRGTNVPVAFIKDQTIRGEVIYSGGGKAVVAFRDAEAYDRVSQELAILILARGYTIQLQTAYIKTDFTDFARDMLDLNEALMKKETSSSPFAALTLPIEEQEAASKLPVAAYRNGRAVSYPQLLKIDAYGTDEEDRDQAKSIFHPQGWQFPKGVKFAIEMEDLIEKKGDNAFVAVVHIDGNGMGQFVRSRIEEWQTGYAESVPKMRQLSNKIASVNQKLFAFLVDAACKGMKQAEQTEKQILPIRPLILDGDDVTFLCKAAWGIPLATAFLREILISGESMGLSACAGIALVHSHFPFQLAYEIAEDCCGRAKQERLAHVEKAPEASVGFLQYQLVRGSFLDEDRYDRVFHGLYRVEPGRGDGQKETADHLEAVVRNLNRVCESQTSKWSHTRLKSLYAALAEGSYQDRIKAYQSRGCELKDLDALIGDGGVVDSAIPDALEIMDLLDVDLASRLKEGRP